KVLLNTEATEDFVKEMNPDVAIVATGATPLILPIPGINDVGVINAIDLLDGKKACGTKVLVVGGGMVGAETAEFLAEQEHEVSIIEFKDKIAGDVGKEHRKFIMEAFDRHNVVSITGAKVAQFYEDGVKYELADGSINEVRGFDSVVLAMGSRNYDPISEALKGIVKETYVIGDAVRARRALNATAEALDVALSI
ncbi:MAG: FAD-dependent oxidoreductase, partial [Intestinibacter sp.]